MQMLHVIPDGEHGGEIEKKSDQSGEDRDGCACHDAHVALRAWVCQSVGGIWRTSHAADATAFGGVAKV